VVTDPKVVLHLWVMAETQAGAVKGAAGKGLEKRGELYGDSPEWQARNFVRGLSRFQMCSDALLRRFIPGLRARPEKNDGLKVNLFMIELARQLQARPLEIKPLRSMPGNMEIADAVVDEVEDRIKRFGGER
jgi:hypothetical protein